jgi:2-hydroxychromene-2-carboxylate isomerase
MSTDSPPGFPNNTISVQRTLASLELSHPQSLPQAIGLFWESFWVHWNDPMKPENLHAIVRTVVGSDEEAKKVIERTKNEEVKKQLSRNTDEAFKEGAFGLPWFVGEF